MQFFPELFTDQSGQWIERNFQFTLLDVTSSRATPLVRVTPT